MKGTDVMRDGAAEIWKVVLPAPQTEGAAGRPASTLRRRRRGDKIKARGHWEQEPLWVCLMEAGTSVKTL